MGGKFHGLRVRKNDTNKAWWSGLDYRSGRGIAQRVSDPELRQKANLPVVVFRSSHHSAALSFAYFQLGCEPMGTSGGFERGAVTQSQAGNNAV